MTGIGATATSRVVAGYVRFGGGKADLNGRDAA
jgi:hypothetical protein